MAGIKPERRGSDVFKDWQHSGEVTQAETAKTQRIAVGGEYLLIVGKTPHDGRVHNPIQQHGEGIDGKVGVVKMPLHHAADLLIGQLHGFHGVLQGTDLLLRSTVSEDVMGYSHHLFTCFSTSCIHIHHYGLIPTIKR